MRHAALILILAWCLAGPPAAGAATGVDGRLVMADRPLAGGTVAAFTGARMQDPPVALSSVSDADGVYSLDLAPGRYYLAAEAPGAWAWCGQNPVVVTGEERQWIGFVLTNWSAPESAPYPDGNGLDGKLSGGLTLAGRPVEGATVSLYLDDRDGFRGTGFLRSLPTGPDGRFAMDLVPSGTYFLIARKRGAGRVTGPMVKGDLIGYYRHNPLRIEGGREISVTIPMVTKKEARDVHARGLTGRQAGFSGTVTDAAGRPVAGVHVFAYTGPEMGHHKPVAISSTTGADGRFTIYLPEPGKYYVGARSGFGDSPAPGEAFGFYDRNPEHSLVLEDGEYRKNVNIVVKKVLAP